MVSTLSFFPEFKTERVSPETAPHLMIGAASPLWLMFGSAAAAGAAWWWWASRWREAVNLEAMIALAPEPVAPPAAEWVEPIATAMVEAPLEAAAELTEIVAEATVETLDAVEAVAETTADALVEVADVVEAPVELAAEPQRVVKAAAPVVEAVVEVQAETAKLLADDLTRLVGIGPKLATSLGELGVTSFSQIAAWTADDLKSIDQLLNLKGRADRDAWIAQAKRFAAADA